MLWHVRPRADACRESFFAFNRASNRGYSGVATYVRRETAGVPVHAEEGLTGFLALDRSEFHTFAVPHLGRGVRAEEGIMGSWRSTGVSSTHLGGPHLGRGVYAEEGLTGFLALDRGVFHTFGRSTPG
eukprot:365694-Chlamydomonas_euryale.AAC.7